jgi:hypothetical protein
MPNLHSSQQAAMKPPSRTLINTLFTSLAQAPGPSGRHAVPRRWTLRRTLRSDNPADITGDLCGTASFHAQKSHGNAPESDDVLRDMVYREEGTMPAAIRGMAGLRWSKKYIWRLDQDTSAESDGYPAGGGISVWFVKIRSQHDRPVPVEDEDDEADYLFHDFEFNVARQETEGEEFVEPPTPPSVVPEESVVLMARGNHLCIKDMYRTAYAFRVAPDTGEVLSWASRHVVKGPKKVQDIVNFYERED